MIESMPFLLSLPVVLVAVLTKAHGERVCHSYLIDVDMDMGIADPQACSPFTGYTTTSMAQAFPELSQSGELSNYFVQQYSQLSPTQLTCCTSAESVPCSGLAVAFRTYKQFATTFRDGGNGSEAFSTVFIRLHGGMHVDGVDISDAPVAEETSPILVILSSNFSKLLQVARRRPSVKSVPISPNPNDELPRELVLPAASGSATIRCVGAASDGSLSHFWNVTSAGWLVLAGITVENCNFSYALAVVTAAKLHVQLCTFRYEVEQQTFDLPLIVLVFFMGENACCEKWAVST